MLSKEETTNDIYRFIRQLNLHEYFYENPNKDSPENTSNTLGNFVTWSIKLEKEQPRLVPTRSQRK